MRLLSLLFLICTWLTVRVASYALPGAYERVLFYYAYLMEIELYGKPKTISPACGRIMGTGGKPCSYDQWVEHSRQFQPQENVKRIKYPQITGEEYAKGVFPDVHKVAKLTHDKGITGSITLGRVVEGFNGPTSETATTPSDDKKYAELLQKVADRVKNMSYDPKLPTALRDGAMEALKAVMFKRIGASVLAFKESEAKRGRTVTLTEKPFDKNHKEWGTVQDFDRAAYLSDNPGSTVADMRHRWDESTDAGHRSNVKALRTVLEEMKMFHVC